MSSHVHNSSVLTGVLYKRVQISQHHVINPTSVVLHTGSSQVLYTGTAAFPRAGASISGPKAEVREIHLLFEAKDRGGGRGWKLALPRVIL